jgi:hypothetical protein
MGAMVTMVTNRGRARVKDQRKKAKARSFSNSPAGGRGAAAPRSGVGTEVPLVLVPGTVKRRRQRTVKNEACIRLMILTELR